MNALLHTSVTRTNYAFSRDHDTHISAPDLSLSQLDSSLSLFVYWTEVSKYLRLVQHRVTEEGRPISVRVLLGENVGMLEPREVLRDNLSETWE